MKEYLDRGICPECGENPVVEDIEMCESCRNKVKRMWSGLNSVMDSHNGHVDTNWQIRKSWETKKEHAERVKTTCPCCGKHKDANVDYCTVCLTELEKC